MNIVLAMSGGVDSSFCALKLLEAGHNISGVYLKLHERKNYHEKNIENIDTVANKLGFSYEILDLKNDFLDEVFNPFLATYKSGLTPNPCALCNREIKLGKLLEFARSKNAKLATGHYAQIENNLLKKAIDLSKDQTYFLANIKKDALSDAVFLLGDKFKKDIKEQALKIDFLKAISEQKESSEICFVANDYTDVLREQKIAVDNAGVVRNLAGEIVGEHKGYMHYTIGKRRGFSVKGAHEPHFVIKIDAAKNELIVGTKDDLKIKEFEVGDINFFKEFDEIYCSVKIRYNTQAVPCKLDAKNKKVYLQSEVFGLASGQLAVFYDEDYVIASAFIK